MRSLKNDIDFWLIAIIVIGSIMLAFMQGCAAERPLLQRYTVEIPNVKIHVLPKNDSFWTQYRCDGMASTANEIWVKGWWYGSRIEVESEVLAHEIEHLMNYNDPYFRNPDDAD